jgi:hypothetical protein
VWPPLAVRQTSAGYYGFFGWCFLASCLSHSISLRMNSLGFALNLSRIFGWSSNQSFSLGWLLTQSVSLTRSGFLRNSLEMSVVVDKVIEFAQVRCR